MIRPLFRKFHSTLQELVLSQDHCISQVGKTPMTLGRTVYDTHCRLDDLYSDLSKTTTTDEPPITLNLTKLELGGFSIANLFDIPNSDAVLPRVRIHLPALRRLVLNNCFELEALLAKLLARKDEIKLTEFAVRMNEEDVLSGDLATTYQALRDFLLCFKGLEVLSVLVEADMAKDLRIGQDVLHHHASTLRAYSVATRNDSDGDDDDNTMRFVSIPTDGVRCKDEISPGCLKVPIALREYGTFLNKIIGGEYARLRHLSQFPDLRTVVIRNFPALPSHLKELDRDSMIQNFTQRFWRHSRISVDAMAVNKVVETFAEQIALPFYALPESYYPAPEPHEDIISTTFTATGQYRFNVTEEDKRIVSELEQIAAAHTASRDKVLGFNLKSPPASPTPKSNPTRNVLKQKANADPGFMDVLLKMEDGTASLYESHAYESYQELVQVTLGIKAPPVESKPRLSLIVVGDWTYRDQMNLSGPRRWDPTAWSTSNPKPVEDDDDDDENDDDDDRDLRSDSEPEIHSGERWNHKRYHLRHGFKKEFDISLLPVFFKIEWSVLYDKKKARYRWCPKATRLEQDTLEGQGALGDVRLLEFAWMT